MKILELLTEDLGNLKVIDPELIKDIKKFIDFTHTRTGGYQRAVTDKFPATIGKNSKVEVTDIKNVTGGPKIVMEPEVKAFVLAVGEVQFLTGIRYQNKASSGSSPDTFDCTLYINRFLDGLNVDDLDHEKYVNFISMSGLKDGDATPESGTQLRRMFKAIFELVSENNGALKVMTIMADEERKETRKARYDRSKVRYQWYDPEAGPETFPSTEPQTGKRITKADVENFNEFAKRSLQRRLEAFKENKAPNVSTPEEFIDLVKKSGYINTIKIKGLTYKLSTGGNINFDKLVNQAALRKKGQDTRKDTWDRSYIMYELVSDGPAYERMLQNLKSLRELFDDDEEYRKHYQMYKMPTYINVFLKLDGSSIVPDVIDVEKFYDIAQ